MKEYEKRRLKRKNKINNVTIEEVRNATENVEFLDINNEVGEINQVVKDK